MEMSGKNESGRVFASLLFFIIVTAGVIAYLFPDRVIQPIGNALIVDEPVTSVNAIVVLLGDDTPGRIVRAFRLYREGVAKKIVYAEGFDGRKRFSAEFPMLKWPLSYVRYHVALRSLDVPQEALISVSAPEAFDTAHELRAIAEFARKNGWTNLALVTSPTHTLRVKLIWHRIAPDLNGFVVSTADEEVENWWRRGRSRRAVAYEYLALVKESWHQLLHLTGRESTERESAS